MSGHTPMMLLTISRRPGREQLPVSMAMRTDCLDCIQSQCSAPFSRVTKRTPSLKKGLMSQRPLMQSFEGTVSIAAHQKWGNLQGFLCSHSQNIPCSTLPVCESHQKEKQVMPRCLLRSKSSSELPTHCLHQHNIGQLWLLLLPRIHLPSMS